MRIYVPSTVAEAAPCGAQNPSLGLGVVTVVVSPAPPGGGDLTLGATNYTRNFRNTSTFDDVPAGPLSITARDVWTDALTAWAPSPASWTGRLYSFYPLTVAVQYAIVPGTLTLSASGFPSDGSATVSAGSYSASLGGGGSQSFQATPGTYATSASPEVTVSRSARVSWTEIYTLQSVSPNPVSVRSYGSSTVSASYSGPLPGTLCEDGNCRQVAPGAYTAPADQLLNRYTTTRTEACPEGQQGSITITQTWERWKVWSPNVVGVSSRGTGSFFSSTEERLVSEERQDNLSKNLRRPQKTRQKTRPLTRALNNSRPPAPVSMDAAQYLRETNPLLVPFSPNRKGC